MSNEKSENTPVALENFAERVVESIRNGEPPEIELPVRRKNNIVKENEIWEFGNRTTKTSAKSIDGIQNILQYAYLVDFIYNQLDKDKSSTLREVYYLSESWDNPKAQFSSQNTSNSLVEKLEILTDSVREDFNLRPEEDGATVIGPVVMRENTKRGTRKIHCQEDIGEGGYQIPTNPDELEFIDNDADFVLAVETGGMRDRLVENGFDEDFNSIVVHLKGQPARATRRVIKRMNNELNLPVLTFADGDPWSYRIYGSLAYGSIKSAHLSKYLATPGAKYIGITPQDIVDYDLPSDPLSDSDRNALENELEDPRFTTTFWKEQIELQLDIDKKAEQQSLASQGLDFVTDTYLPEKLEKFDFI